MVNNVNDQILLDGVEVRIVSGDWRIPDLRDLNERVISIEEVREAVNEIKSGKDPGLDGFLVEC